MKDFQQRVVDECSELEVRTGKLGVFLDTDMFQSVSQDERFRLRAQYFAMKSYLEILKARIESFV